MSLRFPPLRDNAERPVLVTGASSGIGRASAQALAAVGHPVVVGARRASRLDELVATIREAGGEATACAVDVTDAESVATFIATATDTYGDPEVLVSSAGTLTMARVWELSPEEFAAQLDIHLMSVHRLLHAILPGMIDRRTGDVVVIGSDVAYTARPRSGAYVAAKAGLEHGEPGPQGLGAPGYGSAWSVPARHDRDGHRVRPGHRRGRHRRLGASRFRTPPAHVSPPTSPAGSPPWWRCPEAPRSPSWNQPEAPIERTTRDQHWQPVEFPGFSTLDERDGCPAAGELGHMDELRETISCSGASASAATGRVPDRRPRHLPGLRCRRQRGLLPPRTVLDQAAAYPFMTRSSARASSLTPAPSGVQMLHNTRCVVSTAVRRDHPHESTDVCEWGEEGEIDLLGGSRMTIYLVGVPHRSVPRAARLRFAHLYHDLSGNGPPRTSTRTPTSLVRKRVPRVRAGGAGVGDHGRTDREPPTRTTGTCSRWSRSEQDGTFRFTPDG